MVAFAKKICVWYKLKEKSLYYVTLYNKVHIAVMQQKLMLNVQNMPRMLPVAQFEDKTQSKGRILLPTEAFFVYFLHQH